MTVSRSRYELLQPRLALFTRMLQGVAAGRPRAIHRARVAARRLREVLPVLQLDSDAAHRLGRRLRRVTRQLGTVRELDALQLLVEAMAVSGRYDGVTLSRVARAIAEERADVRGRSGSGLFDGELKRLAAKLEKVAEALRGEDNVRDASRGCRWAVDARVRHRADALRKSIDAAGSLYLAERVHTVRIMLKKFRYAAELKAELSVGGAWTDDLAGLKRAQRLLGRLRDRQVLMDRVRQLQASLTPPDLGLWRGLDALLIAVETECRRLHARYLRHAPDMIQWCDRIAGRPVDAPARQRAG